MEGEVRVYEIIRVEAGPQLWDMEPNLAYEACVAESLANERDNDESTWHFDCDISKETEDEKKNDRTYE